MALWRIRTEVDDNPGRLAALAGALAAYGGNVLGLSVQAVEGGVVDEFFVDVPAAVPEAQLMGALAFAGGRRPVAVPADMHELVDAPLRALRLADRLRRDPEELPDVLAELLGAQESGWLPAGETTRLDEGDHDTAVLTLSTPSGRTVILCRYALAFTTTEVGRARAMLAFLNAETRPHPPPDDRRECWVVLPDGTEILIRRAVPADRAAVSAMHDRCSAHSRYLRYLTPTPRVPGRALERLISADRGVALVATLPDGRVVGLANLVPVPAAEGGSPDGTGTAEVALLVEDAWQGRRIGTTLFRRLISVGRELGLTDVSATVLPSNARMWRLLRKAGLTQEFGADGGVLRMHGIPRDGAVRATISAPVMAGSTV